MSDRRPMPAAMPAEIAERDSDRPDRSRQRPDEMDQARDEAIRRDEEKECGERK